MSAFVVGIPAPEGLDPKTYRVRVVVDRIDGAELTQSDLTTIARVYPSKPAKRTTKLPSMPAAPKAKPPRKPRRAA